MNKIKSIIAVIALLCTTLLVGATTTGPSSAKDITWGRTTQARDITWGSKVKGPQGRDITWGKAKAVSAKDITWGKTKAPNARKAWGTMVTHAGDDSGYTGDIQVVCENGNRYYLKPGERTFLGTGKACSLSGVNRIIVAYNQTVYCKNYTPPYENTYFYTGTNYVPSNRTYKCYAQRPL